MLDRILTASKTVLTEIGPRFKKGFSALKYGVQNSTTIAIFAGLACGSLLLAPSIIVLVAIVLFLNEVYVVDCELRTKSQEEEPEDKEADGETVPPENDLEKPTAPEDREKAQEEKSEPKK